jgi:hypothetical protein
MKNPLARKLAFPLCQRGIKGDFVFKKFCLSEFSNKETTLMRQPQKDNKNTPKAVPPLVRGG